MAETEKNILEIIEVSKTFPGVKALDKISFSLKKGEIRSLSGENGAGKSTLIKILTGVYKSDGGKILFDGKEAAFAGTRESAAAGIRAVFQELNLIPYLTVAENLVLEDYPVKGRAIDWKKAEEEATRIFKELGVDIDIHAELSGLGAAAWQMVSIAIALRKDCRLMILDEPTSSLDKREVEILFSVIEKLKARGVSFLFITHRLEEVFQICDSITILKDGACIGTFPVEEMDQNRLVSLMVGRTVKDQERMVKERAYDEKEVPIVELRQVKSFPRVANINLKVYPGEILGIAGLLGSGRSETAQIIAGCRRIDGGAFLLNGRQFSMTSPITAKKQKIVYCTENRRVDGIIPNMSVKNNMILSSAGQVGRYGVIEGKKCKALVRSYIDQFRIKTPSEEQKIKFLSGGNQQKVLLARGLSTNPKLVILDEPTRGIDVGAKQEILDLICEISGQGIGVIFISSDLSELVKICHRVIVFREGTTIGCLSGEEITQERIMETIAEGERKERLNG